MLKIGVPAGHIVRRRWVRVRRIVIEVRRVRHTPNLRLDRRRERPIAQPFPVETVKPPAKQTKTSDLYSFKKYLFTCVSVFR